MKTVYVILLLLGAIPNENIIQEDQIVKAVFDYYDKDDETFYFVDPIDEDETYTFVRIEENVLKSFDLTDEKYEGQTFNVTYKVETEIDDFDEDYDVWIIVKLELVK